MSQHVSKTSSTIPVNNKTAISIVFSTDERYFNYLSVAITSLIMHANPHKNYEIYILSEGIQEWKKDTLIKSHLNHSNVKLIFVDMKSYAAEIERFKTLNNLTKAAYYRLFSSEIFNDKTKILYLDTDIIIECDISELYEQDLSDNYTIAVKDFGVETYYIPKIAEFSEYMHWLGMKNINNYFNSGVLLLNLDKIRKENKKSSFLKLAEKNNKFFNDQNILNVAFENHVKFVDECWNYQCSVCCKNEHINKKIIHFCSKYKPWNHPEIENAYIWWHYARQTPFYEEIIYKNACTNLISKELMHDIFYYRKNRLNYFKYRLLANLTFGKTRTHYKCKKQKLKAKLKAVQNFIKG